MVLLNVEMPLPPSYKCPVCQKEKQRGLIGDHVVTHSLDEIRPYIVNLKEFKKGLHPEVLCSGHTYIICYNKKQGFEKGKPKHLKHICKATKVISTTDNKEKDEDMSSMTMNQVLDICRKKNVRGYSHKSKEEIIELILEHDKIQTQSTKPCTCHNEITKLKAELLEKTKLLERFQAWLDSAPTNRKVQEETTLLNIVYSDTNQIDNNDEADQAEPVIIEKEDKQPKLSVIKEPKTTVIKASKKEQEKGMYCTKCEVCGVLARNNRELKACGSCNKLCHFNSDFFNCYHWECAYCNLPVCMDCNKAAGGNKLFAFCSKSCYKKQNS